MRGEGRGGASPSTTTAGIQGQPAQAQVLPEGGVGAPPPLPGPTLGEQRGSSTPAPGSRRRYLNFTSWCHIWTEHPSPPGTVLRQTSTSALRATVSLQALALSGFGLPSGLVLDP